ncbi:MAG: DUF262 domain-containing protein [Prevotella sp.]|jgi:hypothetical protein|nr:DUF262 domain-containing protein [Prevotella sp.]
MMKHNRVSLEELEDQLAILQHRYDYSMKEWDIEQAICKFVEENDLENNSVGRLIIPKYQRKFVWEKQMQCNFIESLFLGIPILPLMAFTLPDGNFELIDGVQRLSTIKNFLEGKLSLHNLEILDTFNGYSFKDLPLSRRRNFNAKSLRFYILSEKADPSIRADIFKRINTSGKKLTDAEIRKGAFMNNSFYNFILECVETPLFKELFSSTKDEDKQRGEKEELLTRFFAYSDHYTDFIHSVKLFLNDYIVKKGIEGFREEERIIKKNELLKTLEFVKQYIPNGFRKTIGSKSIPRVRFEAIAIGTNLALKENPNLVPNYTSWLDSKEFQKHTTSDASNNKNKLVGRIEFVRDCLLNKITEDELSF